MSRNQSKCERIARKASKYDRRARSALPKFEKKIIRKLSMLDAGGKVGGNRKSYYRNGIYLRFTIINSISIRRNRFKEMAVDEYIIDPLNDKYEGRYIFTLSTMRNHIFSQVQIKVMWYDKEDEKRQANANKRERQRLRELYPGDWGIWDNPRTTAASN